MRVRRLFHPYAYRQFHRGSGAWGRVTKRDRQRRAAMWAKLDGRIASGEHKPIRYLKDEVGRFVRVDWTEP